VKENEELKHCGSGKTVGQKFRESALQSIDVQWNPDGTQALKFEVFTLKYFILAYKNML